MKNLLNDNPFIFYFTAAPECDAGQWSCSAYKFNNTNCIPNHHRCDKEVDCHDQSDEQNCSKFRIYIFLLDTLIDRISTN